MAHSPHPDRFKWYHGSYSTWTGLNSLVVKVLSCASPARCFTIVLISLVLNAGTFVAIGVDNVV
ncbi:hypothetical protein QCA50_011170 [Cerrena zonata]|uniref:Uncharacterized protein n=1 Tax=Cerrena zonata TaxID=2478898 RepID=A0AAW0G693_9APHY